MISILSTQTNLMFSFYQLIITIILFFLPLVSRVHHWGGKKPFFHPFPIHQVLLWTMTGDLSLIVAIITDQKQFVSGWVLNQIDAQG